MNLDSSGGHSIHCAICNAVVKVRKSQKQTRKTCGGDCFKEYRSRQMVKSGISRTHGMYGARTYGIWAGMIQRCVNKSVKSYPRYGGAGITVCDAWIQSFEAFYADMGEAPIGYQIDRKDSALGYEKDNCRWVDLKTQARNRRSTVFLTVDGETKPLPEWAEKFGISGDVIRLRLRRGWSDSDAVTAPINGRGTGRFGESTGLGSTGAN